MADTAISFSSTTGQTMKAILFAPQLVAGNLQAWNPTLGTPAYDTIGSGNWIQHLISVPEPGSLGVYVLDLSTLTPALAVPNPPGYILIIPRFYASNTASAIPAKEFGTLSWNGTSLAPSANVIQVNGTNAIADPFAGRGAFKVTVAVTSDGTTPIVGAMVRLTSSAGTYFTFSDTGGNASFSLDANAYALSVTAAGYSYTPTIQPLDNAGKWAGVSNNLTLTLTAIQTIAVSLPNQVVGSGYAYNGDGTPAVNQPVYFQLLGVPTGATGAYSGAVQHVATDQTGAFSLPMFSQSQYLVWLGAGPKVRVTVTTINPAIAVYGGKGP